MDKFDKPKNVKFTKAPTIAKPTLAYRYFCEACTGRAFYAPKPEVFKSRVCNSCGKLVEYKPENWLALSDEELAQVN